MFGALPDQHLSQQSADGFQVIEARGVFLGDLTAELEPGGERPGARAQCRAMLLGNVTVLMPLERVLAHVELARGLAELAARNNSDRAAAQ